MYYFLGKSPLYYCFAIRFRPCALGFTRCALRLVLYALRNTPCALRLAQYAKESFEGFADSFWPACRFLGEVSLI